MFLSYIVFIFCLNLLPIIKFDKKTCLVLISLKIQAWTIKMCLLHNEKVTYSIYIVKATSLFQLNNFLLIAKGRSRLAIDNFFPYCCSLNFRFSRSEHDFFSDIYLNWFSSENDSIYNGNKLLILLEYPWKIKFGAKTI